MIIISLNNTMEASYVRLGYGSMTYNNNNYYYYYYLLVQRSNIMIVK
jgi:hypothetical protein